MSKNNVLIFAVLVALTLSVPALQGQDGSAIPGIKPAAVAQKMSEEEFLKKASFLLAYNQIAQMNNDLKAAGIILDEAEVMSGVKKALAGEKVDIPMGEIQSVMTQLQTRVTESRRKQQDARVTQLKAQAETNKAAGDAFLAENAKKQGVQTLDGGIQYEVLVEGTGRKPSPSDGVKINYHGTTVDGKVFDSSIVEIRGKQPKPIDHVANGFVEGFNTAVQSMPIGSKWRVVIPSEKAYGLRGPMGPNQTLIFEIELLDAWEKEASPAAPN